MVTHIHQKFYRSNATKLSEADINEIRESRGKIPNASARMSKKFHIGARRVYEIWEHSERLQQSLNNWNDFPPNPDGDDSSRQISDSLQTKEIPIIATTIKNKKESKENSKASTAKSKTMDTLVIAGNSSVKLARSSQSESKKISREELDAYYKQENEDDKKHKANMA
ncbi:9003_t:CDS:1, partial [Entrophospora sp. SA101]